MAKPVDLELKKAFADLQVKMVETSKKIKVIDSQIDLLDRIKRHIDLTKREFNKLPSDSRSYEPFGRGYLLTDFGEVKNHLLNRENQVITRLTELTDNKQYLEKNLKESQDNIREMVQQRKEKKSNPTE